jgi:hypothetical protein
VYERHPEVSKHDVLTAWKNCLRSKKRSGGAFDEYVAVGVDLTGRLLEMIVAHGSDGTWLVFHAMKATKKTFDELGMADNRRKL